MPNLDAISRDLMLDSLREYAKRHLPFEYLREHDQQNQFPEEILRQMYDIDVMGIHLLLIPKEYGGLGGSTFDIYRICEALARIDLGVATSVFATFLGTDPLKVGGTEEQKKKWMSRIANEKLLVAYAATEADAGSDLVNLRTRAEHVTRNGKLVGYKINGNKQWISNGGVADVLTVLALAPGGPSWFIVEKTAEGFSANKHEDKHGIRLSNTAGLSFDDVIVPADQLIGEVEGQGLQQAQAVFGYTRLMVAAFGLGCGWEALETAVRYSQQRIQAGGPLSEKQGYTHKLLVPHAVRLSAARAYIEEVSNRLDSGEHGLQTEGAIGKYFATEEGNRTAEDAIQALGGYGYTRDFSPEKIKRDVKITCIYEGTSEIMEMTICRGRWQEHLKSRGKFYADMAAEMDALHASAPDVGAAVCASGLRSLGRLLEECRVQKLTRHQYVMFSLGSLISEAEAAAAMCRVAASKDVSPAHRFDRDTLKAMARVNAREAAFNIATRGLKLACGAAPQGVGGLAEGMELPAIEAAQAGNFEDMDFVSAKLNEYFKAK